MNDPPDSLPPRPTPAPHVEPRAVLSGALFTDFRKPLNIEWYTRYNQ
jgi:hypothetical protein